MLARVSVLKALSCLVLLLVTLGCLTRGASAKEPAEQARITAMKVSVVDAEAEGGLPALSNIFEYGLRNNGVVFAGTGTANYPVHNLLVMVEVLGDGWQYKVELRAAEGRRLVYRKVGTSNVPSGASATPAKSYAFFLIEGDRCERLRLTASLVGARGRKGATSTQLIDFACGE